MKNALLNIGCYTLEGLAKTVGVLLILAAAVVIVPILAFGRMTE